MTFPLENEVAQTEPDVQNIPLPHAQMAALYPTPIGKVCQEKLLHSLLLQVILCPPQNKGRMADAQNYSPSAFL